MNRSYRSRHRPYWQQFIASALGISLVFTSSPSPASDPEQALIDNILGNSSELIIRRSGRRESAQIGSVLQQIRDALITAPPNNAYALLRFLSGSGEDLNFYIQTNPHSEAAIYYFPCQMQGGDYWIGWGLARTEDRGCENGLTVTPGRSSRSEIPPESLVATKQLAQAPTRQIFYCGAIAPNGQTGFATVTTGDPCTEALEQCQSASGGPCETMATGFWWTSEVELQATFQCAEGSPISTAGTGETLATQIQTLLPQATSGDCGLQVYKPQDFILIPATDDVVAAQGDDEILVQTRDTGTELQVDVLKGAINVQTTELETPVLLTMGERYVHSGARSEVTTFDRQASLESVEASVLCAFASQSATALQVSACREVSPDITPGIPLVFCDREQASGGQEGDRRAVQMSTNSGEIELEYEMFAAPDRLQIIYEGQEILDTDFVSGNNELTIPYAGESSRMEVIVTGNVETATTEWNYTLSCP
ncbi:MAG: hypothetical protein AAFQ89_20110 [Cyanobacteria bacterium J06626_18]